VTFLTLIASGPYAGHDARVSGAFAGGDVSADVCVDGYGAATVHIGHQADPGETVSVERKSGCADGA
jgi:hypothetical protein